MKLHELIKSHNWLSVKLTMHNLYPDQRENIDEYKRVFECLQMMQPINDEMLIVLTEQECGTDHEINAKSTYIDVAGRKRKADADSITESYALEFVKWENWLGMKLAPEIIDNFNELEIITHCLYEMTFCGYRQEEIQKQFDSIKKTADDFKSLTDEDKKRNTITLDELKKRLDEKGRD